jgi:hypothetical protein
MGRMAMKSWIVTTLVMVIITCMVAAAWGQVHLPKGLEDVIPVYPGAEVVVARDMARGSHTMMETRDDFKAVLVFFRKAMAYKGWTVMTGMAQEQGATIVFSKGSQTLQITARDSRQEKTTVLISMTGL